MNPSLKRWVNRTVVGVVGGCIVLYAGDWALYRLRGEPSATVTVESYQTVPLKGHKVEYDYLGADDAACSVSLFPQGGMSACWWLRSHPKQTVNL